METGIILTVNLVLLLLLAYWLRYQHRIAAPALRPWLLPALAGRLLLSGVSLSHPSPDFLVLAQGGPTLATSLAAGPAQLWLFLQGNRLPLGTHTGIYYPWSNTLFFNKILTLLSLPAGGRLWAAGLYLSLLCFTSCWCFVRQLYRVLPQVPPAAAAVAFLAWPSVIWWTAGLTKETAFVGAATGVAALAMPAIYGARPGDGATLGRWLLAGLLAWIMIRLRYYFALPLLGGWLVLGLHAHWHRLRGEAFLLLALAGSVPIQFGGQHFSPAYFRREIIANAQHGQRTSLARPHAGFFNWEPTPAGLLRVAPVAVGQVLLRPWPGESARWPYVVAGLENMALLGLVLLAAAAGWRGRPGRLPLGLTLLLALYTLLLAAIIGLSTPNFGTMSRYRTMLLPWLLLLLLQNDYARALLRLGGRRPRRPADLPLALELKKPG